MAKKVYIGDALGVAKTVKKIYIGDANGRARKVIKGYIGDAQGNARLFWGDAEESNIIYYNGNFLRSPAGTDIGNIYHSAWNTNIYTPDNISIDDLYTYFGTNTILTEQGDGQVEPLAEFSAVQTAVDFYNNLIWTTSSMPPIFLGQKILTFNRYYSSSIGEAGKETAVFIPVKRIYNLKKIKAVYYGGGNGGTILGVGYRNSENTNILICNPNSIVNSWSSARYYRPKNIFNTFGAIAEAQETFSNIEYVDYIFIWSSGQNNTIFKIEIET